MRKIFFVLVILALVIIALCVPIAKSDELSIYMFDVGQGDSFLIISPDNKKMLVDTGANSDVIRKIRSTLGPFDNVIDYVVTTHGDKDHSGALKYVLNEFYVTVNLQEITENSDFNLGCCVTIDFVWPETLKDIRIKDTNSGSVTFFLKFKDFKAFFPGDLPINLQEYVTNRYSDKIDLLKISHHGSISGTSGILLSTLNPKVAMISVGKTNSYGHPHSAVIKMLEANKIILYRTDEMGTVRFVTNGVGNF